VLDGVVGEAQFVNGLLFYGFVMDAIDLLSPGAL
jgi:hypothetical protein